MENKEKPAVITKIIAGGVAGASETMITVSIYQPTLAANESNN
jgi:hypothetical protein